ncbi:MAG: hypothetical protein Q9178_000468 [Gyalolechia marmorata]
MVRPTWSSSPDLPDPCIGELEAQKCTVQTISGDVARYTDVQNAIKTIGKPIGGVIQATMVLDVAPPLHLRYSSSTMAAPLFPTFLKNLVYPPVLAAFTVASNVYVIGGPIGEVKEDIREIRREIKTLNAYQTAIELKDSMTEKLFIDCSKKAQGLRTGT